MSDTKEPYKKYWAYQGYPRELVPTGVCKMYGERRMIEYINKYPPEISMTLHTYLFDTQDEAYAAAEKYGEFDGCMSKEDWCKTYDEKIFEICESELEDYSPVVLPNEGVSYDIAR